jgi:hypothetical protein
VQKRTRNPSAMRLWGLHTGRPCPQPDLMRSPPDAMRWWPKLRDPFLIASVSLLILALMMDSVPEPGEPPPTAQELRAQKKLDVAYAIRHRVDAVRFMNTGQYEDALARLKQAAKFDPEGDKSPDVDRMRDELLVATGFVIDDKWWPGPTPRPPVMAVPTDAQQPGAPPPTTPSPTWEGPHGAQRSCRSYPKSRTTLTPTDATAELSHPSNRAIRHGLEVRARVPPRC